MTVAILFIMSFLLRTFPFGISIKPGAILGALTVVAVYVLIKGVGSKGESLARLTAFFLAINPWHILVSREFWQLDICLLLVVLGILFFFHFSRVPKTEKAMTVLTGGALMGLFFSRYLASFSTQFLFFNAGWSFLNRALSYQGTMYFPDIIFSLWGLGFLLSKKRDKLGSLILLWLLLAPWPAVFSPHKPLWLVSFGLVIPLTFLVAQGVEEFKRFLEKKSVLAQGIGIFALIGSYGFCLVRFFDLTLFHP